MSVAALNNLSKPSVNKAIDSSNPAPAGKDGNQDNFANTLNNQEQRLKESGRQDDATQPQEKIKNQANHEDQPEDKSGQSALVALLEQYLPLAKAEDVNQADEPGIYELTAQQPVPETNNPGTDIMALTGAGLAKPAPPPDQARVTAENTEDQVVLPKPMALGQTLQNSQSPALPTASAESSDAFQNTLASITETNASAPEVRAEAPVLQKPVDARMESYAIAKPVVHPGWSKDLGEHILWMNNKDINAAEIKLNPAHLGPISVRIDVGQDNQASIMFTAQHAETKEALEASVPKLREMLNGQQLNLVNVNISQNFNSPHGRQQSQLFQNTAGNPGTNLETLADETGDNTGNHLVTKGLLSLYA